MTRRMLALFALAATALPLLASAQTQWTEGKNYFTVTPALHTSVPPGKVEVTEVFSYACPHCSEFRPVIKQLRASLPSNAVLTFVPASFNPSEDWPMFQRAYVTAEVLGVADRAHEGIFDAVWKSGELAVVDPSTNRLKNPPPSIEDAARVYNKLTGVPVDKFLAVSQSTAGASTAERSTAIATGMITIRSCAIRNSSSANFQWRRCGQSLRIIRDLRTVFENGR